MGYVFISYSTAHQETADAINELFNRNGIKTWMAPYDIPGGSEYAQVINDALKNCSCLAFVFTDAAQNSRWVRKELERAINYNKVIIPIKLEDVEMNSALEFYLSDFQVIPVRKIDETSSDMKKVLNSVIMFTDGKLSNGQDSDSFCHGVADGKSRDTGDKEQPGKLDFNKKGKVRKAIFSENKANKKKRVALIVISVFLVTAIIVGAVFINRNFIKSSDNIYHITLTAPDDMSEDDFKKSAETIKKRVKIFSNSNKYAIDIEDNQIQLYLPKSEFHEKSVDDVLNEYISRAVDLYALNINADDKADAISIERDDIASIEVADGPIADINAADYGITTVNYNYFIVSFKDEFINENQASISEFGDGLVLAQDIGHDSFAYYYALLQSDGNTVYLLNSDLEENFTKLLEFNLTNDPLAGDFNFDIDIESETNWENEENVQFEKNQCNVDDFNNGTVIFSISTPSKIAQGEKNDVAVELKRRLDSLDIPYAFGSYDEDEKTIFTIKLEPNKISLPIINLLYGSKDIVLKSGAAEVSFTDRCSITRTSGSSTFSIRFALEDEYYKSVKEQLENFVKYVNENNNKNIYFYAGDYPFLSTTVNNIDLEQGTITFNSICSAEGAIIHTPIDEDCEYIFNFIANVFAQTDNNYLQLSLDKYQFKPGNNGKVPTEQDFAYNFDFVDNALIEKITDICPSAVVYSDGNSDLSVMLNLPVDNNIVNNSIEYAKDIYETVDFENSFFDSISIYLVDEADVDGERARIFFEKQAPFQFTGEIESDINAYGIFQGGRLDAYKDEFRSAVQTDEFMNSISDNGFVLT